MIFSYNWLQSFFKQKLPKPEKLAQFLTLHSFEVSEVKKTGTDYALDIDILPNRPDCLCHLGIAREISVLTGLKCGGLTFAIKPALRSPRKARDLVQVEIKNKEACPRYTARVIDEIKVSPSPKWIQERLRICGLRPINNVVDIANYVMLETGQPLHAFDLEKIERQNKLAKIIVRFARKEEKIVTLDGEECELDKDVLVIADSKSLLAIAGIKGGKKAEITKSTKTVVLESANFDPGIIRQGSKKLGLKTDASIRFEKGLDPNLTPVAINRAANLLQNIAKGKASPSLVDVRFKEFWPIGSRIPQKIALDLGYVERLLGMKIPVSKIRNILSNLGFKIKKIRPQKLMVEVPTCRLDISLAEDLIEEIGRIYGYDAIRTAFPQVALIPPRRNWEVYWESVAKSILKEAAFSEVYNYSFLSGETVNQESFAKIFGYAEPRLIEVQNPISSQYKYLRPSLIPNLLKNVKQNLKYFDQIRIFELGKVFQKIIKKSSPIKFTEKRKLAAAMAIKEAKIDLFYQLKGISDLLLKRLGLSDIWYDSYQSTALNSAIWHPKKCAEIKVDGQKLGFLGEISSQILEQLEIGTRVVAFDFDFEKLRKYCSEEIIYWPISKFPAAVRDIAVLVPRLARTIEVMNAIHAAGGPLIRDIELFDVYEGEKLPRGKKNLAFHIIFQARDRALSAKEIEEIQNKIITALERDPQWQVRR